MDIKTSARKFALQNAVRHDGKATQGAIIGKLIAEDPSIKEKMGEIGKDIAVVVAEVNKMSLDDQRAELQETAPELLEKKKEEEHKLPVLDGAEKGKVVTAFPPEPSGYPHLGHAKGALVNYWYAKEYEGKFVLRFEDTNPDLAQQEFYDVMLEGLKWIGVEWDELVYISDLMDIMYQKAVEMLDNGHFYACRCEPEQVRKNRMNKENCDCRDRAVDENKALWQEMVNGKHEQGDVVIRWKSDMAHKNTAMRDPTMLRIILTPHVRQGDTYKVWPAYDFASSVSDGEGKITHRVRSKEFELRTEVQNTLQELMGYDKTVIMAQARFNLEGVEASKRKIREGIREGDLMGWDDPRLATLAALKRRGFVPEALQNFLRNLGVTKTESTITWDMLAAENRKIIDADANRYFFIEDPVQITVDGAPEQEASVPVHPDHEDRGKRTFKTGTDFYITKKDAEQLEEGALYRLMDCVNFTKKGDGYAFDSVGHTDYKGKGKKIMHWLPVSDLVDVEVVMPDASVKKGLGEATLNELNEGDIIQFERFGFVRLDKKEDKLVFWFAH